MRLNKSFTFLLRRWAKWLTGLAFIGFSIAFMKHANLGLGPWDVLNESLAGLTGIQLGTISITVGAIVLLLWVPMREKFGINNSLQISEWVFYNSFNVYLTKYFNIYFFFLFVVDWFFRYWTHEKFDKETKTII